MELREALLKDVENIVVHGRTVNCYDPVMLLWGGSSLEMRVQCSELHLLMEGTFTNQEQWIAIEINGEVIARQMLKKEKEWICIFRNITPTLETNVRIIKEVQAMYEDEEHCLKIYAVKLDGELLPVEPKKYRIEFIGDSITSAEGTIGAKQDMDWISMYFSHVHSYPYLTSKYLDADYQLISQSGWGVYTSFDNNTSHAIPKYYKQICGVATGESLKSAGFLDDWNFNLWQPQIICVNLGTNDNLAIESADGTYPDDKVLEVKKAIKDFLGLLREKNPKAYIIYGFGILKCGLQPMIEEALKEYKEEQGDCKVKFITLPEVTTETFGSRQHPGYAAHQAAAKVLAEEIKEILLRA